MNTDKIRKHLPTVSAYLERRRKARQNQLPKHLRPRPLWPIWIQIALNSALIVALCNVMMDRDDFMTEAVPAMVLVGCFLLLVFTLIESIRYRRLFDKSRGMKLAKLNLGLMVLAFLFMGCEHRGFPALRYNRRMPSVKRLGILTAGGDCPGLNAVIRAVVKSALRCHPAIEIVGILDGYAGLVENRTTPLSESDVSGILVRGGTILGTSNRDNPFHYLLKPHSKPVDRSTHAVAVFNRLKLDGLIAVGGDGTLRCALEFERLGVPVIGVPKTIDNDLGGTDVTFGFDSALAVATEAVDRLHTTAESHHRVLICEVMGRHAGWIALHAGMAGGGDVILIPEIPYDIRKVCDSVQNRKNQGKRFSIIVAAEGAAPIGGAQVTQGKFKGADKRPRLGGISHRIAEEIERRADDEVRVVVLGHLQRGGTPTPFDRWLATHFGVHAVELAVARRWGQMVALRGTHLTEIPIAEAVSELHRVDPEGEGVRVARAVGTSFGN